jgi:lipopolysaccharide export system ATP-binding protein
MKNILSAKSLVKRFKKREVIRDISLTITQGEIVGLLGPNGAGKTTTFRMISGEEKANSGTVWFNNVDITHLPMYKRARLGMAYLPQEPSSFRGLTTEENIAAILELNGLTTSEIHARVEEVLKEFDMTSRRNIKAMNLSGGERRRLEVMRALALHPFFMLLDEPFAGVDPIAVEELQRIVAGLKQKNIGVLITDHNVHETLSITDRAYIINEGKVLAEGAPFMLANDKVVREIFLGERFRLRDVS